MKKRVYPKRSSRVSQISFDFDEHSWYASLTECFQRRIVVYTAPISFKLLCAADHNDSASLRFLRSYLRKFGNKEVFVHDTYLL